jgi:hypothetical protein
MLVGLGFKVAASPFHVWTPDVYEGAPAPVVGLMSTAPKAAAFAVLLRVLFAAYSPGWFWPLWLAAALSMTLGNLGALVQSNVKRLLAYSSIAHAGYLLVAFAASSEIGISAAIFYAAAYAAMNVGAFAVVSHFAGAGERCVELDDYAGLGRRSPVLAAALTLFLLSLIGIPVTGGFFAKLYVFSAALRANLVERGSARRARSRRPGCGPAAQRRRHSLPGRLATAGPGLRPRVRLRPAALRLQNGELRMQNWRAVRRILHSPFCILHFSRRPEGPIDNSPGRSAPCAQVLGKRG